MLHILYSLNFMVWYKFREEDSHPHVHQQPSYLQLQSQGQQPLWLNAITVRAVTSEQLVTGRWPVQIPTPADFHLPPPLEQGIWPCQTLFFFTQCHKKTNQYTLFKKGGLSRFLPKILFCFIHKLNKKCLKSQMSSELSNATEQHSVEMWAELYCWCCMWPRLGFSALQG